MPDPFEDKRGAVPIKDIYSFDELARLLHCSPSTIRDRASWEDDPLPLRRMNRARRGTFVWRDELWEYSVK